MYSRRDFLKTLGAAAGAVVLNGCARDLNLWDKSRYVVQLPSTTTAPGDAVSSAPTASSTPGEPATQVPTGTQTSAPTSSPTSFTVQPASRADLPYYLQTPATPGDQRKLCFVLWDHQLAMYGYRPRNMKVPLPETVPLKSGAANRLTKAWIAYWKGILHVCNPDMEDDDFEAAFKGLVADSRAFTNGTGPESGNFALHSLTCGGATHQMVNGVPEGNYMRIYTLNIHDRPPRVPETDHDIDMTRHFFATTGSNVKLLDGSYAVYGFPQFDNCIVPLVSPDNTDLIDVSRIKVVTAIQSPYNTDPEECFVPFGCTATPEPWITPQAGLPEGWPWAPSTPTP